KRRTDVAALVDRELMEHVQLAGAGSQVEERAIAVFPAPRGRSVQPTIRSFGERDLRTTAGIGAGAFVRTETVMHLETGAIRFERVERARVFDRGSAIPREAVKPAIPRIHHARHRCAAVIASRLEAAQLLEIRSIRI